MFRNSVWQDGLENREVSQEAAQRSVKILNQVVAKRKIQYPPLKIPVAPTATYRVLKHSRHIGCSVWFLQLPLS